jgi:hypothetical protein
MAKVQGNDVILQLSEDGIYYKTLICEIGHTLNKTRDTQATATKCDGGTPAVSIGAKTVTIDFTAATDTAPTGSQCSFKDVDDWYEAGTLIYWKQQYDAGADIYQQGRGYITSVNSDSQVGGIHQFTGTINVDGAVDTTV